LKKFIKETKELCGPYKLPREFKFYTDVFESAYNQMDKYMDLLLDRYVDFMEKVISDKTFSFKSKLFQKSLVVHKEVKEIKNVYVPLGLSLTKVKNYLDSSKIKFVEQADQKNIDSDKTTLFIGKTDNLEI
jgi:hypothetical protein